MPLDEIEAVALTQQLWPAWRDNREKSKEWQAWALGKQTLPSIPDTATEEYRKLQEKSCTPWLGLVVQAFVQALFVEGYRTASAAEDSQLWSVWQANRMDAKQSMLYEGAFTTGVSYLAVLPTDAPRPRTRPVIDDVAMPEWRPYSSAEMTAFYESPYDDWPVYAMAAERAPRWRQQIGQNPVWRVTLFDEERIFLLEFPEGGTPQVMEQPRPHGSKTVPVVGFVNRQTITGRVVGEVEPYVAVASRIDQDVFDRLIVQRFGAWRTRYATGLMTPDNADEQAEQELMLKVSDILTSDSPDTKFGSLPESSMDGLLRSPIEDARVLAAVAQIPATVLTGDMSNTSAEALDWMDAAHNRKLEQRKITFGESCEKAFDLSARLMDLEVDAGAQVRWRDMDSRNLAQIADAFGKLSESLSIPAEVLWDKLPFLTEQDRERAKDIITQQSGVDSLLRELASGLDV